MWSSGATRRPRDAAASPRQSGRRNTDFSRCWFRSGGRRPPRPGWSAQLFSKNFFRKLSHGLFFVRTAQLDLPPGENGGSLGTGLSLAHDQSVVTSVTLSQATRCVLLMCRLTSCSRVFTRGSHFDCRESHHGESFANERSGLRESGCFFQTPARKVDWAVVTRARRLSCLLR